MQRPSPPQLGNQPRGLAHKPALRIILFAVPPGAVGPSTAINGSRNILMAYRITGLAVLISAILGLPANPGSAFAESWGFDLNGADFEIKPGDDFFRYSSGAWFDRAVIPSDRSSIGVSTALTMTAEVRIREILERGKNGVPLSVEPDAAKIGAFYTAFMNEARAEALDAQPIAPVIEVIRAAKTREELAALMGTASQSFFGSVFRLEIGPDDKAPDRYAISVSQGGLGLDRDYYVNPRLGEKKAAYLG